LLIKFRNPASSMLPVRRDQSDATRPPQGGRLSAFCQSAMHFADHNEDVALQVSGEAGLESIKQHGSDEPMIG
jgi:hypothetical protein